jgi:hypothetical protein
VVIEPAKSGSLSYHTAVVRARTTGVLAFEKGGGYNEAHLWEEC